MPTVTTDVEVYYDDFLEQCSSIDKANVLTEISQTWNNTVKDFWHHVDSTWRQDIIAFAAELIATHYECEKKDVVAKIKATFGGEA